MRLSKSNIRLVLDWDGTLTKKDTLHLVAAIGYDHNRSASLRPWDDIVQAYISDYKKHAAQYSPALQDRRTAIEESCWLASLKEVERRSIERVRTAGIFKGVTEENVVSASRSAVQEGKLQLRPGSLQLLNALNTSSQASSRAAPPVSILSVNWSARFIKACLATALTTSGSPDHIMLDAIPIYANELPLDEDQPTSYICTSEDKLAKLEQVREEDQNAAIVYVGDSATDFDCLVAADIGICVRDEPLGSGQKELKDTLERVGIEISRLEPEAFEKLEKGSGLDSHDEGQSHKRKIWWVSDLDEISRLIRDAQ